MPREIRRTMHFPHPPERVWTALTDARALSAWLMPTDFVAEVGRPFTFQTDPAPGFDGTVHGQVLEVDPPHRLRYSWRGGPIDTVVTYELAPSPPGTLLRFSQSGFQGMRARMTSWILDSGWRRMMRTTFPAVLDELARRDPEAIDVDGIRACAEHGWFSLRGVRERITRRVA